MTVRVLFCHGLESGPLGRKVVGLREAGFAVTAPDMEMSLFNPARRNSVVRSLLSPSALLTRWPSDWLGLALADSFDACVDVQRAALADGEHDVLLGSSWGGAVAAALLADGSWKGPAVIMCPALAHKERRAGGTLDAGLTGNDAEVNVLSVSNSSGLQQRSQQGGVTWYEKAADPDDSPCVVNTTWRNA